MENISFLMYLQIAECFVTGINLTHNFLVLDKAQQLEKIILPNAIRYCLSFKWLFIE